MELRKVVYHELPYEFNPEQDNESEGLMKDKEGLFHKWITEETLSPQSEQYVLVTKALIEKEDGTMVAVDYPNIKFVK